MWRCFVRDQARVPSVAGAGSSLFRNRNNFFSNTGGVIMLTYLMFFGTDPSHNCIPEVLVFILVWSNPIFIKI